MTAELGQMCKKKSRLNTAYHFSETYLVVIATHYILDMLEHFFKEHACSTFM